MSSGASWQIKVDYDRSTVDSNPARVSDAEISWHDADDSGNYTLDRKSGKLTVIVPSSTGGYISSMIVASLIIEAAIVALSISASPPRHDLVRPPHRVHRSSWSWLSAFLA